MTQKAGIRTCVHKENLETIDGIEVGTCAYCGQQRSYPDNGAPKIIKRGYIDGVITAISPPGQPDITEQLVEIKTPEGQTSRQWYNEHKKEMINDLLVMGNTRFLEKWKVNPQILSHLKSDKIYKRKSAILEEMKVQPQILSHPDKRSGEKKGRKPALQAKATKKVDVEGLPRFPAFNDSWAAEVQVKWLDTYFDLCNLKSINKASKQAV